MHTSFFSELNLGFFRGMVKASRRLGDIVAFQYQVTIANSQVRVARARLQQNSPLKSYLSPLTFSLQQPRTSPTSCRVLRKIL
jgi:hypothetical protein